VSQNGYPYMAFSPPRGGATKKKKFKLANMIFSVSV